MTLMWFAIGILMTLAGAYLGRHKLVRLVEQPVYLLFHYFYYRDGVSTWSANKWQGVELQKLPLDLWTYQEIIHSTRPDLIIETGTYNGGSALFFANLFDLLGNGRIVTVDLVPRPHPAHPRIEYISGSSTAPEIIAQVLQRVQPGERVMVILDSDHSEAHVAAELKIYASLATPGCYLVVEDTNVCGHPVYRNYGPGPMEALHKFLPDPRFRMDKNCERQKVTFYPDGWLLRL